MNDGPYGFRIGRVGNGVTDLDLARPFYEALGFVAGPPFDLGVALSSQAELPGSPLVIQIVHREGFDLELVQHGGARPPGRPPARRPMNQLGLTHLALAVDDVDRVAAAIARHGGSVCDFTRTDSTGGTAMFCLDPCGLRILLLGPGSRVLHEAVPGDDGIAVDHIGVCVADLDRTVPFYQALGFRPEARVEVGTAFSYAAELDGVPLTVQRLRKDAYPVLLQQWGGPRPVGVPVRLPLDRVGQLIHFGTHGNDFEALLALVVAHGGSIVERTRGQFPLPGIDVPDMEEPQGWIFVLDPNGVQIEIVAPR